nr:hypothetical protein GCM10020063_076200 [Dactylosporangium thailandense]
MLGRRPPLLRLGPLDANGYVAIVLYRRFLDGPAEDAPLRLLRWAVGLLSAQRAEWGRAMLGEPRGAGPPPHCGPRSGSPRPASPSMRS